MGEVLSIIGFYEVICVLFSGIITIISSIFLGLLPSNIFEIGVESIELVAFICTSYFVGMLIQFIGSAIEKTKYIKLQYYIKHNYLKDPKILQVCDCLEIRNTAQNALGKNKKVDLLGADQYKAFIICKDYLESNEKDGKAEILNSLSNMSRNLMVVFIMLWCSKFIGITINCIISHTLPDCFDIIVVVLLAILIPVFYYRAKEYAKLRILAVFRHYKLLKDQSSEPSQ